MAKKNLLLVDADPRSLRVLEVSLRKAGYSVAGCSDAENAIDMLELSRPDLILADTRLPGTNGFELLEGIRRNGAWADIPFIFLASDSSVESKVRGLELGVEDYLTKPIYIKEIITRVNLVLQRKQREGMSERDSVTGKARFTGSLADMGLVDLIQTIDIGKKTGVLYISSGRQRGAIYFRDGALVDAELGRLRGAKAVYRALVWGNGRFEIDFRPVRVDDAIKASSQAVLMEGMRRMDEWGHFMEQLPPLEAVFEIDEQNLIERLAEIPDEINEVLKFVDGANSLLGILESTSGMDDLDTLGSLSKLYFEGIIFDTGRRSTFSPEGAPGQTEATEGSEIAFGRPSVPARSSPPPSRRSPANDSFQPDKLEPNLRPSGKAPSFDSLPAGGRLPGHNPVTETDSLRAAGLRESRPVLGFATGREVKKTPPYGVPLVREKHVAPKVENGSGTRTTLEGLASTQSRDRESAAGFPSREQGQSGAVEIQARPIFRVVEPERQGEERPGREAGAARESSREQPVARPAAKSRPSESQKALPVQQKADEAPKGNQATFARFTQTRRRGKRLRVTTSSGLLAAPGSNRPPDEPAAETRSSAGAQQSPGLKANRAGDETPLAEIDLEQIGVVSLKPLPYSAAPPPVPGETRRTEPEVEGDSRRTTQPEIEEVGNGVVTERKDPRPPAPQTASDSSEALPPSASGEPPARVSDRAALYGMETGSEALLAEDTPYSTIPVSASSRFARAALAALAVAGVIGVAAYLFYPDDSELKGPTDEVGSPMAGAETEAASAAGPQAEERAEPEEEQAGAQPGEAIAEASASASNQGAESGGEQVEPDEQPEPEAEPGPSPETSIEVGEPSVVKAAGDDSGQSYEELLQQAKNLDATGKRRPARELFMQALAVNPSGGEALSKLAFYALNSGKNETAADYAFRSVSIDPGNSEGWIVLGAARSALKDRKGAREAYRKCVEVGTGIYVQECRRMVR